jgi:8-oxo-dGTP diphosphatase
MQTLEPLAARLHGTVLPDNRLIEGGDRQGALELVATLPHGSVLCSHGDIIPDVMAALERRSAEIADAPDWRKGTVWVLSRVDSEVVSATVWPPPNID